MKNEEMLFDPEKLKDQEIFETPEQANKFAKMVLRGTAKRCIPQLLERMYHNFNLSQRDLAQMIGITQSTLNIILNGGVSKIHDVTQDKIYEVCDILDDTKDTLVKLTSEEKVNLVKTIKLDRKSKGISTETVYGTPDFYKWFKETWFEI